MIYELIENKFNDVTAHFDARIDLLEKAFNKSVGNNKPSIKDKIDQKFPLETIEDVNSFEAKLINDKFYIAVRSHLLKLNGTGLVWRAASYKLCNFLFTK